MAENNPALEAAPPGDEGAMPAAPAAGSTANLVGATGSETQSGEHAPVSGPLPAEDDPEWIKAQEEAFTELQQIQQVEGGARRDAKGIGQKVMDVADAAGGGVVRGLLEVKDMFLGEPSYQEKSRLRKSIEASSHALDRESAVNAVSRSIAQFGIGFVGLGKLNWGAYGVKALQGASKSKKVIREVARGAAAGAITMDPHEERLSNVVESFPAVSGPITRYLAANPNDTAAEGRLKNALEGVVLDVAATAVLAGAAKFIRARRAGNEPAAAEALTETETALARTNGRIDHEEAAIEMARTEREALAAVQQRQSSQQMGEAFEGLETPFVRGQQYPKGTVVTSPQPGADGVVAPGPTVTQTAQDGRYVSNGDGTFSPAPPSREPMERRAQARPQQATDPMEHVGEDPWAPGGTARSDPNAPDPFPAQQQPSRTAAMARADDSISSGPVGGSGGDAGLAGRRAAADAQVPIQPEDVERAIGRMRRDNDALHLHGGRDGAEAAGHVFRPDREGFIPWQKLRTSDEVEAFIGQVAQTQEATINRLRGGNAEGVLTDSRVNAMVAQRANVFNEDPAALIGALREAGEGARGLAANMETAYLITNRAFQDTYELSVRIGAGNLQGFGSRAEAVEALRHRTAMSVEMMGIAKSMSGNAGRAMRRMRGQFRISDAAMANLRDMSPEDLVTILGATNGDPRLIAQAATVSVFRQITDGMAALQAANLLWGWKTQAVNAATSALMLVWRPLETGIGAAIMSTRPGAKVANRLREFREGSSDAVARQIAEQEVMVGAAARRTQSAREVTTLASTIVEGWNAAMLAFRRGESVLTPHGNEANTVAQRAGVGDLADLPAFRPINSMEDATYNAIVAGSYGMTAATGSLRVMGAADEMVKQMRYRAIVTSKATLEAEQAGMTHGSRDFDAYVRDRLDSAFDDIGRGIEPDAVAEARRSTFQQDLLGGGTPDTWGGLQSLGSGWQNFAHNTGLPRFITPFIKTPANLIRYGIKLTPGLNLLQKEYLNAVTGTQGVEAQARAVGQMSLGILLAGQASILWATGRLTGSGPQDPKARSAWIAQGNRPNSITWWGKDGARNYFELTRFDPIMQPLLLVGDALSIISSGSLKEADEQTLTSSVVVALQHLVKDKTFLRNINDAIKALSDDDYIATWAKKFAPGFLPFSSLMNMANTDPVLHETRTVVDAMKAKVPGLSASLPPQRDIFGDVVLAPGGFTSEQRNPGPLARALDEVLAVSGGFLQPPSPRIGTEGIDLRDVTLKSGRNAFDRFQELAGKPNGVNETLKAAITRLVTRPEYAALPHGRSSEPGTKSGEIMKVVRRYRDAAMKQLMAEDQGLRDQRYRRSIQIRDAGIKGRQSPQAAAQQGAMKGVTDLLGSFGLGGQ